MKKYFLIANATFQEYLIYRLNFLLWRLRNIFQLLVIYFLWASVFVDSGRMFFGYSQSQIFTYVIFSSFIRSYVTSGSSLNGVGANIVTGELTNYLVKPIGYIRYVFSKDLADKVINVFFSVLELTIFIKLLNIQLVIQGDVRYLLAASISLTLALLLYFFLSTTISMTAFWLVDDWWSPLFLFMIILESLSGGLFPIDILPAYLAKIISFTPFPYILYYPTKIYLGQLDVPSTIRAVLVSVVWVVAALILQRFIWKRGIKKYEASGH